MQTRKEFLSSMIGMFAGAAALAACGSSDPATPDAAPASCAANGTAANIGTNHGHSLSVSKQDVSAGVEKTYDITGSSGHAHSVKVTAAMFAMLQANTSVTATSTASGDGHTHAVTINCI